MNNQPELSAIWIYTTDYPDPLKTLSKYLDALSELPYRCELTVVGDLTAETMSELESVLDHSSIRCTVVSLHRDFDNSTAISAGLNNSSGELVALLPPYLQSDPNGLHQMLIKIKRGCDYVATWRSPRVDPALDRMKSRVFNWVTRKLTGVDLHDLNSDLRLMRREVTEDVPIYSELDRFLPILVAMNGYRVSEVKVRHVEERRGRRRDGGFGVYFRRILDLITLFFLFKFTRKPLRFFGMLGGVTGAVGALITLFISLERLLGTTALSDRPALLFGILLLVLGVQLFSLGLLGELIIFVHGSKLGKHHVEKIYERESDSAHEDAELSHYV